MVRSISFSKSFENDTNWFLFGNLDKLPHSIDLFLSQNLTKTSSSCLFVYSLHNNNDVLTMSTAGGPANELVNK